MNKKIALFLLSFIAFSSCSKSVQEADTIPKSEHTQIAERGLPISLSLDGVLDADLPQDEEARAFAFNVTNTGPELKLTEEKIPSVVIIANADKSIVYYLDIKWSKTVGQNHLYFKDTEITTDLLGQGINLSPGNQWYIMGYLGGTFDNTTKEVRYNPNGARLISTGTEPTVKNVPIAFAWTPLEVKYYGQNQLALSGKDRIRFKTLGMMMRLTLKNEFSSSIRIKNIRYQSNALSTTAGHYNLSVSNLPATNSTALPTWISSAIAEPKYPFGSASGAPINVDLTKDGSYYWSFLVWAMPKEPTVQQPMTHVLAEATRLTDFKEETYPKMSSLYIWGSTNIPKERTRRKISARIYRDKMALEYFAKNYVGHNGFNVANLATPELYTTAYWGNIPLFSYPEVSKANALRDGWRVPYYKDARGLYFVNLEGDNIQFTGSTLRTLSNMSVRVNGEEKSYTDVYKNGSTIYALRFDGNDKKIYSAWRYNFSIDGGATIEAVYLGPNYKGNIDNISQNEFWLLHQADIIKRSYRTSYYTVNNGQQTRSNMAHFWALSETVPNLANPAGYRRWTIGVNRTTNISELSHIRHSAGGVDVPSNAHIIPIEAVESTPTWHD